MKELNIVLYEPEIPQNTGNIMRTCVATNTKLHLIKPLGFKIDEKSLIRSGVNYIKEVELLVYDNYEDFLMKNQGVMYYLTRYGKNIIHECDFGDLEENIFFIIGKESTGIPKEILEVNYDKCIRLPMTNKTRALNISNVAAIMVYEALRQRKFHNLEFEEPENMKGSAYLKDRRNQ